ncbi:hypothetical protein [Dongia sp.]|jgi:hypothetical protein|uniref:hypothetical protein n=1 Tax=Dongia sp. TaxID=1977262 RepID=UPI0035ADE26A
MMTLPLDGPESGEEAARKAAFAATERQVERAVETRARERRLKDDLRRSLYRQTLDGELARLRGGDMPGRWQAAARVAVGGFVAFLIVIWLLGPADFSLGTYLLIAGGGAIGLGLAALLIVAVFDRAAGRKRGPSAPVAEKPAERPHS